MIIVENGNSLKVSNTLATLGTLFSVLQNGNNDETKKSNGGSNINVLEVMGSIAGALQNNGQNQGSGLDAASLLQGLGGMLGGGQPGQGGLDISTIGSLINMLAQTDDKENSKQIDEPKELKEPKKTKKATEKKKVPSKRKSNEEDDSFDMTQMLSLAQNFLGGLGGQNGKGKLPTNEYIFFLMWYQF